MSPDTFSLWVIAVGQIAALLVLIWNKFEQARQGKTLDKTYHLTNSAYGALLQTNEISAKRLAEKSGEEGDAVLAQAATKQLIDHDKKQAIIDAEEGKPPAPAKP